MSSPYSHFCGFSWWLSWGAWHLVSKRLPGFRCITTDDEFALERQRDLCVPSTGWGDMEDEVG